MFSKLIQDSQGSNHSFSRRQLLGGAAAFSGVTLFGAILDQLLAADPETMQGLTGQVETKNGGTKPVYVPAKDTKDPVSISHADTLFWTDILMEHGLFFAMLMPGPELAAQRAEAEKFQATFKDHFAKVKSTRLDRSSLAAFNRTTVDLAKPFIEYKHRMNEAQKSGKIHSLVWPLFFEHTANEAERFVKRLDQLSTGQSEYDRTEVVDFWTGIMGEHAEFIAHLLDPQEDMLVDQAQKTAEKFEDLDEKQPAEVGGVDPVMAAGQDILKFKETAGKGITSGKIKSIIPPALADHVRREAVKFLDELERTKKS